MKDKQVNLVLDEDKIRSIVHNSVKGVLNENSEDEGFGDGVKKWLDKLRGKHREPLYNEDSEDSYNEGEGSESNNDFSYNITGSNQGGISDNPEYYGQREGEGGFSGNRRNSFRHMQTRFDNGDENEVGDNIGIEGNETNQEEMNNQPEQISKPSYKRGEQYNMEFRQENEDAFNNVIAPAYKSVTSAIKSLTELGNLDYLKVSPSIWNSKNYMTGGGQKECREVKEEIAKILPLLNDLKAKMKLVLYHNGVQQTADYQHYGMEEQKKFIKKAVMEELQKVKSNSEHGVIDEETIMNIAKNVKMKFINENQKLAKRMKIDESINNSIENICKKLFG